MENFNVAGNFHPGSGRATTLSNGEQREQEVRPSAPFAMDPKLDPKNESQHCRYL